MTLFIFFVLLISSSGYANPEERREPQYSPASSIHHEPTYASASEMSAYPQHLDLDTLKSMPLVILHPRTPITFNMIQGESMKDLYKSLTPERIVKLLQSASSSSPREKVSSSDRGSPRQAKNLNFESSQTRSLPFNGFQSFLPRMPSASTMFSRPFHQHPSGNGWQERFRSSFSNMFSFAKPFSGMAATHRPAYMPFHQPRPFGPFPQPLHQSPTNMFNQFQQVHPLQQEQFASAASYGHPTKLQLGSYFNPFRHGPLSHHQYGGDLATSGSTLMSHRIVPASSHRFANYVSTVPRHKPLFNNIGGLKGASLEISNAFADFTDSHEHGPEVSQKFGSVGHTMNKFLEMMGLGANGGISMDEEEGFGGAGSWASMDPSPISRSLDFYPGYGNQAHLEDIDDFPIFLEDITEKFLTKMNLTHLLSNNSKIPDKMSEKNATDEKTSAKKMPENTEEMKMKSEKMTKKPDKPTETKKDSSVHTADVFSIFDTQYVQAQPLEMLHSKSKSSDGKQDSRSKYYVSLNGDKKKTHIFSDDKVISSADEKKMSSDADHMKTTAAVPAINYKVPTTQSTVSPQDRVLPVMSFRTFPSRPQNERAPDPPKYSPAQPIMSHHHESEDNPNKLVNDDILRPWIPVSSGQGYVEKRPKPLVDISKNSDQPKGLKIVEQVLSGASRT